MSDLEYWKDKLERFKSAWEMEEQYVSWELIERTTKIVELLEWVENGGAVMDYCSDCGTEVAENDYHDCSKEV